MKTLIDQTYFCREINLPEVGNPIAGDLVCKFIDKYEPRYLVESLGYAFAKQFLEGLGVEPTDQRWLDLLNGCEWQDKKGNVLYFEGLRNSVTKVSPIANYVYYFYVRSRNSDTAMVGEVRAKTENSYRITPAEKMVNAWNDMVAWTRSMWYFLERSVNGDGDRVYPEFCVWKQMPTHFQSINSFGI